MKDKIYWHDAHHEALQLELYEYADALEFKKEHALSKEALRMDSLVIKKVKDVKILKNIGKIFKNHNIVEYKSENDNFTFWDYQKVLGYAFIYSSFEKVQMSEITISISLTIYPRELAKFLENERGFKVENLGNGIYYIEGDIFPIQILESKNLPEDENLFLRNLRSNLTNEDMLKTLQFYSEHRPSEDKNVYLDRLIKANFSAYKEAMKMSEAVKEVFIETAKENGWLNDWLNDYGDTVARKIAKKLLLSGKSIEEVVEYTELPIETVESLI
ncbi:MAG: 3-isopropylmalate dehydrogenase [Defluviitaleaceae bacterium]|nr:3-isopropylmalate dehydrogenase [Defluviitaleaceae bacterium]